jgi:hypothetical protein
MVVYRIRGLLSVGVVLLASGLATALPATAATHHAHHSAHHASHPAAIAGVGFRSTTAAIATPTTTADRATAMGTCEDNDHEHR